ncbi:MAG TPA: SDR family NAD(P)-dependent oxidoreductase, partial [Bacteriovoracaceae bacterium]|nr:SDR family NAD(P)-dependent oxidoreductase [Bacteriovoracaceae bacterium]
DVTDREALQKAILEFSHSIGLDLLIASAGISFPHKTKIPDFERSYYMVQVNLLGVMYAFEAALKVMLPKKSGHLVAISSVAGFNGLPGVSAYSATKSAVTKYCESLNLDLADYGITVTSIHPGFVDTPLTRVNPHPMPFLQTAPQAARKIAWAIRKKKMHYSFPFLFSLVVKFLSLLPRTWYKRLMTIKLFNFSKEH